MKATVIALATIGGWWSGFTFTTDAQKVLMVAVFIAVIVDWATGIAAAYKDGIAVTSSRMRQGVYKLIGYFALILISVATAQVLASSGIQIPQVPVLTASLALIFATESLSVLENVTRLTGMKTGFLKRLLNGMLDNSDSEKNSEGQ